MNWHGRVFPEFTREVKIVDPFPESSFQLAGGNNSWDYIGGGGGKQFKYLLKVTDGDSASIELSNPRLYLDSTEILLSGQSPKLKLG